MPLPEIPVRFPQRFELIGGPMDGDRRSAVEEDMYFESTLEGHVNYYLKLRNYFYWQGIIPWRPDMKYIFRLNPGQEP